MMIRSQLFVVFLFVSGGIFAQCPITVSAGPDKFVCNNGGTTVLDGVITGQEIGFRWTPSTGLSSNMVLNPTATVNGPVTYTLTAAAVDPSAPNLVNNPGFENGNTGFSSGYSYSANPITPGTYFLTTSPSLVNSNFPPCDDHTFGNGTGYMMLVNGNGGANSQVWCQTIPVMPNSWYNLSAWTSTSPISPPALQFVVNNVQVGSSFTPSFAGCSWQEFTATWFSGSATSATLCINDISGSGNGLFGDDFVLDDISMTKACTVSDQVNVSVVAVNAVLPANVTLSCAALTGGGLVLNGTGSTTGPGIVYSWDGPGVVSGGNTLMPTVNEPGTYTLTVSFDTGDVICSDQATINVVPDPFTVIALASANEEISCLSPTASLTGAGSTIGALVTYSWSPAAGVVTGINTLNPEVNQPGVYTLLVTHTSSGCTATATANVDQNITPAVAAASSPGTLPCMSGTITLSGNGSSTGSDYAYQWSGPGIVSGSNTLNNCVVSAPGLYRITVTNVISGCTATATTTVTQSVSAPIVNIAVNAPGVLNCNTPSLVINSTGSSVGANFTYQWGTTNGHFTGPLNGISANIDTVGTYALTITNTQNGCTSSASIGITGQFTAPTIVMAQPVAAITCIVDSVQINASGSSSGNGFLYQWSTNNGNILSGDTTLTPWVNAGGNYTVTITNTGNGCSSTAVATVPVNTTLPTAVANAPGVLNCSNPIIALNSTGSSSDTTITFLWSTSNGHFTGPTNMPTANADSAGVYILHVTNSQNGCNQADTISLSANFTYPSAVISLPTAVLDCAVDSVQINASGSSAGMEMQYNWSTTNGAIQSGNTALMPWVNAAGNYTLSILNTISGCTATAAVNITQDTVAPVIAINTPPVLDCGMPQVTLSATGTNGNANWIFTGTGTGIVSGQNTLTPVVSAPGIYRLTLTNPVNHCQSIDSVTVIQNGAPPVANAGPAPIIDCNAQSAILDGSGSSQGSAFIYLWSAGSTSLQQPISSPGTYTITVTNTANQCTSSASVTVPPFGGAPNIAIDIPPTITCTSPQIQLNATASTGPEFHYSWTFNGAGNPIIAGDTTLTPTVNASGDYVLTALNSQSGCTASATVNVAQSSDVPVADAGTAPTLVCGVSQINLDGTQSGTGPNLVYNWTTTTGNILQGNNTLMPSVNAPGTYTLVVLDTVNGCSATDAVVVMQDANVPVANAGATIQFTCLTNTLTLDGSGSSSGNNFTYLWSTNNGLIINGNNSLSPTVGGPGDYILQVTNTANNCQSTSTVQVTDFTQLPTAIALPPSGITCAQNVVTLSGTGSSTGTAYTYLWTGPGITGGATTLSPTVNLAGAYTLVVTRQNTGCTASATVQVTANTTLPTATAASPSSINCIQNQTIINGTGSSTGNNFTYIWSGPGIVSGNTTLNPVVNATGNYVLIVTDQNNSCTASATVTVNGNTTPPVATIGVAPLITCIQPTVTLNGNGSTPAPNATAIWTGPGIVSGGTSLLPVVNAPGNYNLVVTDQNNGCTATASVTVTANTTSPVAVINVPTPITCAQSSVTIDAANSSNGLNFNYLWTGPGIVSGGTSLTPIVNTPGNYTLKITNQTNGCTIVAPINVSQDITPPNANAGQNLELTCKMPEATLQGSSSTAGVTYNWATLDGQIINGQTTNTPTVGQAGTYILVVTNPVNGCTASASATVTQAPVSLPVVQSEKPDCQIPTGSISFNGGGSGPFQYSINGGQTLVAENVFPDLAPGMYDAFVQDTNGCKQLIMIDLPEVVIPQITLDSIISAKKGAVITLNPQVNIPAGDITSILWTPADGLSCTDCLQPEATINNDITYQVVITSNAGCTDSAAVLLKVQSTAVNIYIPNTFTPDLEGENKLFRVFTDAQIERYSMSVFDRWGSLVFTSTDIAQGWDGTARGKMQNPGVYIYYVQLDLINGNGDKEKKLLKGDVLLNR